MWLYVKERNAANTEDEYQVGFYHPKGIFWVCVETYFDRDAARRAVNYLNGGTDYPI